MRIALRVIAIAGAVIVVGSLFLHWYETKIVVSGLSGGTVTESGWVALHERDIALVVIAGAAIVLAVLSFFMPHRALMAGIGVLGIAALALAIVGIASPSVANRATELENELNRIVAGGATQTSVSADVGAYLALAGSAILAVAGIAGALTPGTKRCPDCAKAVPLEAHVCHHCGYRFESRTIYAPDPHNRDGG